MWPLIYGLAHFEKKLHFKIYGVAHFGKLQFQFYGLAHFEEITFQKLRISAL